MNTLNTSKYRGPYIVNNFIWHAFISDFGTFHCLTRQLWALASMTDRCCFGLNPSCWTFGNVTPWLRSTGNDTPTANPIRCNTTTQCYRLMHLHGLYCQRDMKAFFRWATDGSRPPLPVTPATPRQSVYQSIIASDQYLQQSFHTIGLQSRWGMIGQWLVPTQLSSKVRLKRVLSKPLIPTKRLSAKSSILTVVSNKRKRANRQIEMFVQTWTCMWICIYIYSETCKCAVHLLALSLSLSPSLSPLWSIFKYL